MMNIQEQTITFLAACLLGMCIGVIYDAFRISRIAIKTCAPVIFIEDVLFFVIAAIMSFIFIVVENNGVFRGFLIIGEVAGALLYFSTLSILLLNVAKHIITVIKAIFKFIYKYTIGIIISIIIKLCKRAKTIIIYCTKRLLSLAKRCLKSRQIGGKITKIE